MKWANPITPTSITGQQTLTEAKPITAIHRAVKELQESVVAGAEISINGSLLSAVVRDNKLIVDGTVGSSAGGSGAVPWSGQVTVITGVIPTLSVENGSTLRLKLEFTGKTLDFSAGTIEDATIESVQGDLAGTECE